MGRPRKGIDHHGPTTTVRVTKRLMAEVTALCGGRPVAAVLSPHLEAWVAAEFAALPSILADFLHRGFRPADPRAPLRADGTLRLLRWQVRRLGIVAELTDRWVGELVEEKLWAWVEEMRAGRPAEPAHPAAGMGQNRRDPASLCCPGRGNGR